MVSRWWTVAGATLLGAVLAGPAPAAAPAGDGGGGFGCAAPEARQFDFWIGEWNVLNRTRGEGSAVDTGFATDKVYPILDGCAVVEHWRGVAHGQPTIGFSVRAYDPARDVWVILLSWPRPEQASFGLLEGGFHHGRGEFYFGYTGDDGKVVRNRYTFSDVRPDALRWDAARSQDGKSWETEWVMEFTRRDPERELPLWNGPSLPGDPQWCSAPEGHTFDPLLGRWQGSETTTDEAGNEVKRPAAYRSMTILGGCAALGWLEVDRPAATAKHFAVRAYLPTPGKWVQYELDNRDPVFRRSEGATSEAGGEWLRTETAADGSETRYRTQWQPLPEGGVARILSLSRDAGESWTTVSRIELARAP